MRFVEIIDVCYKRKKDGSLSQNAINFASKCGKNIDEELSEYESLSTIFYLSKQKQPLAFELIRKEFEVKEPTLGDARVMTYKQFAKLVHPDFTGGKDDSFKALQEVKEFLWDYKGVPRPKVKQYYWSVEKEIENGGDPFFF
jgi:hypothetical protein